jgi:hypothetical protein
MRSGDDPCSAATGSTSLKGSIASSGTPYIQFEKKFQSASPSRVTSSKQICEAAPSADS